MLLVAENSLDCFVFFEHLLMVTAALASRASHDSFAHYSMDSFSLLFGNGEVEEGSFTADELEVLDVLSLTPMVVTL
jgi:hypothetical protein